VRRPPARAGVAAFKEALRYFRSRVPVVEGAEDAWQAQNEETAWTVAGVADLDLVKDVWKALDRAIENGTTFEDFKANVAQKLTEAWGGEKPWRLETLFRTSIQTAYSAGRWEQATDPEVAEMRPFFRFIATLDTRTTEICRPLHGTVLPQTDPFWRRNWPPLHFQCRSAVLSITEEDAAGRGVTEKPASVIVPQGFGLTPDQRGYEPDLSDVPPELLGAAKLR
jgi:SPP1 gp7 family putative phage head morphogenesis protein